MGKKQLISMAMVVCMAVLIINSCKKAQVSDPLSTQNGFRGYTANELAIWQKLTDFNRKIKSVEKSGESIPADSAIWYLEALFNATQTTNESFDDFYADSTFYTIPVDQDGNVNMEDVSDLYSTMVADFQTRLSAFTENYKIIVMSDLFKIGNVKSGEMQIGVNRGFGLNTLSLYEEFGYTDNWYYGNQLGKCSDPSTRGSDAGFELERRFNHPYIQYPVPHDSTHVVASSIIEKHVHYTLYPDYIYNILYPNGDTCISYNFLNYLLIKGHEEIIYKSVSLGGQKPEGKDFYYSDVRTSPLGGEINGLYRHSYILYYGVFVNIPPLED